MVSVDEHTNNVIEIAGQGAKLTEELILKILKSLNDLFEKDNGKQDFVIKDNTIEGKQKIKDLVSKHKDGVMALDDNITKEQVKDYQNEFKKMGVDFSIVKNDKDSYSFFFASRDANVIEKSLKNIIEKKNLELENKNENELGEKPKIRNIVELNPEEKQLANTLNELSPQEQALFMKINEVEISNQEQKMALTDLQKGLSDEQVKNVHDLYKENVFTGDGELPKDKILSSELEQVQSSLLQNDNELDAGKIKIKTKENELNDSLNKLSPKEQVLFEKMNELDGLKNDLSTEQIENVQNLHSEIVNINSISKEEQLDNIFNQLSPEEKDLFLETNEYMLNPDSEKQLDNYTAARDKLSEEQISKVDGLYNENIHDTKDVAPKGKIHMNDIDKITENLTMNKQLEKQSQSENNDIEGMDKAVPKEIKDVKTVGNGLEKEKIIDKPKSPSAFSIDGIKEIDKLLKEKEKNNDKDKKRDKELSL
ncbi:DUF3801 domain-containing protein [Sporosarcina sp. BP05]|uniref:DUF3801 domain-containing protein n=1 Tax=Sporosarcina sp. BP05 TaxID=2758726 RepID=UPI001644B20D|nr:DUF3801 domain-containing protein [Sporosarcina sp. BP05]